MADQTAVYALYISIGGLMVSIVSACFARSAQKQAKKAATLTQRIEAIEHVRQAIAGLTNNAVVTPETLQHIRDARDLSELVFSPQITKALDLVCKVICSPMAEIEGTTLGPYREGHNLDGHLRAVLEHMNKEAKLGS